MTKIPPLVLALLTLLVAGCGDGGGDDGPASAPADAGAYPVSIKHKFGTTTIDRAPRRVVTVGFNEHDFALALGVRPVGVRAFIGGYDFQDRPWARSLIGAERPALVGGDDLNYERIAAQRPDLILGIYSFMDRTAYTKLAAIAPTIAQSARVPDGGEPWDAQLATTGRALGHSDEADRARRRVDAQFANAREDHPEFLDKRLAIVLPSDSSFFVLEESDLRQGFFGDLGFKPPPRTGQLGLEQMRALDQDVLIVLGDGAKLERNALFRRLRVARQGRVIDVPQASDIGGALGFNSPLSRPFLLGQIVPRLVAALDGRTATKVPAVSGS